MTAISEQIVTFTGPTTSTITNHTTWTAANGDRLYATFTGTATTVGPDVTFSGLERFSGGTGRFKRARGEARISGSATFISNTGSFRMKGLPRSFASNAAQKGV